MLDHLQISCILDQLPHQAFHPFDEHGEGGIQALAVRQPSPVLLQHRIIHLHSQTTHVFSPFRMHT